MKVCPFLSLSDSHLLYQNSSLSFSTNFANNKSLSKGPASMLLICLLEQLMSRSIFHLCLARRGRKLIGVNEIIVCGKKQERMNATFCVDALEASHFFLSHFLLIPLRFLSATIITLIKLSSPHHPSLNLLHVL